MEIDKLTEKGLVSSLRKNFAPLSPDVVLGIGDDAAVVKIAGTSVLLTKDLLIEDFHFKAAFHPPELLGRKSLNVNLSDIAAMGGRPRFALLGLGLPPETDPTWVDEFFIGLKSASEEADVQIVGGDISRSRKITISVSIVGTGETVIRRDGARPGDRIVVSGTLGTAKKGLLLLKKGIRLGEDERSDVFLRSFLDPVPRLTLGKALSQAKVPSAMIDVSDGLSVDLHHICQESQCGAEILREDLPVLAALKQGNRRYRDLALHGGEDYELLFTVPPHRLKLLSRLERKFHLTEIGRTTKERRIYLRDKKGRRKDLAVRGFQHF